MHRKDATATAVTPETVTKDRLIGEAEAAQMLGVSRGFLRQARMNGTLPGRRPGPPFIRVGLRGIRYSLRDLMSWIQENRVRN